jgi:hypothetical protein
MSRTEIFGGLTENLVLNLGRLDTISSIFDIEDLEQSIGKDTGHLYRMSLCVCRHISLSKFMNKLSIGLMGVRLMIYFGLRLTRMTGE